MSSGRSQKTYFTKKSQRFSDLARSCWSMRLHSHVERDSDMTPQNRDSMGANDVIPSDSTSEITYQNPDGNTPEASDDSVTNSEVQHLEDVSEDTVSTASLEVQNILMAGEITL